MTNPAGEPAGQPLMCCFGTPQATSRRETGMPMTGRSRRFSPSGRRRCGDLFGGVCSDVRQDGVEAGS